MYSRNYNIMAYLSSCLVYNKNGKGIVFPLQAYGAQRVLGG
jgi:hypothetical protein